MTGRDPFAVGSLLKRLRNPGESDRQRAGEFGGRLVSELADRTMLIGCVLLVTEDLGGGGAGHRHRQDDDPGAPAGAASCEPRVRGSSFSHPVSTLAENRPRRQGRGVPGNLLQRCHAVHEPADSRRSRRGPGWVPGGLGCRSTRGVAVSQPAARVIELPADARGEVAGRRVRSEGPSDRATGCRGGDIADSLSSDVTVEAAQRRRRRTAPPMSSAIRAPSAQAGSAGTGWMYWMR